MRHGALIHEPSISLSEEINHSRTMTNSPHTRRRAGGDFLHDFDLEITLSNRLFSRAFSASTLQAPPERHRNVCVMCRSSAR
jgi:hypothetical protein